MNVFGKVIASIIYDSRCGMSDVAFCTAPPIGGPSCSNFAECQPEVAHDVVSDMAIEYIGMDVHAKFVDSELSSGRIIRLFGRPDAFYTLLCTI